MLKNFTTEKGPLPKNYGYPLRSSFLLQALEEGNVPFGVNLIQRNISSCISVDFWPPNPNVDYERLYIVTGAVPSAEVHSVRDFLETTGIPQLVSWAQQIATLPLNSPRRREKQHFGLNFPM